MYEYIDEYPCTPKQISIKKKYYHQGDQSQPDDEGDGDDDDDDDDDDDVAAPSAEGCYDPSEYDELVVESDVRELFVQILKYTPQTVDLDFKFRQVTYLSLIYQLPPT